MPVEEKEPHDAERPHVKHDVVKFEECSLLNSDHAHAHGYSRAICSCGWKSAASPSHPALVALFELHVKRET